MDKIDFVITWVDGNDPEWQKERSKYRPEGNASDVVRFRDWGLMKYWFRGVEKYAPWVNKVYFVTCGHYPAWLNLEHPKLVLVKHSDYIPDEYLPTFNSNVIELNLHRIQELSEQFVLFNDDMFLLKRVTKGDFFRKGMPCETVRLGQICSSSPESVFPHTILNNMALINQNFDKRSVMKKYWRIFFSLKYGRDIIHNILMIPYKSFSAFYDTHVPTSHLKSTFIEIWKVNTTILNDTGYHRFRDARDVTHWLMKCWRICKGSVEPRSIRWGKMFTIGSTDDISAAIRKRKCNAICINDSDPNIDFEYWKRELSNAFETILPDKSSFEL